MVSTSRPVRFGVMLDNLNANWPDMVHAYRLVEELGFDTAWDGDHPLDVLDPNLTNPALDGWSCLAALAAATTSIRLGCLVTGNTYRHPAILAKMATTVDHVSKGRLDFGLGAGWSEEDHVPFGIPFYTRRERGERLDEAMEVITRLWTEPKANFSGRYYQLRDAIAEPKPYQRPFPPVMIGGSGEKLTLRVVAKWASMWNASGSPNVFKNKIRVLEERCAEVGRDPQEIEKSVYIQLTFVHDHAQKRAILEQRRGIIKRTTGQLISEDEAVNGVFLGSSEEIKEQVRSFIDVGVTHFILNEYPPYKLGSLERFAREVIPSFR
jgi:F420-dependent oxidoreductase-like protein